MGFIERFDFKWVCDVSVDELKRFGRCGCVDFWNFFFGLFFCEIVNVREVWYMEVW